MKFHLGGFDDEVKVFEVGLPDLVLQLDFVDEQVQTLAAKLLRFDVFMEQLVKVLCQRLGGDWVLVQDGLPEL